jgi:hypothetical protein
VIAGDFFGSIARSNVMEKVFCWFMDGSFVSPKVLYGIQLVPCYSD